MDTTLNTLITLTFFAPAGLMVVADFMTRRSEGPMIPRSVGQVIPLPPARAPLPRNENLYLQAA